MSWEYSGRERSWWIDSSGKLVMYWAPILSEVEDTEEKGNPLDYLTEKQRFVIELRYGLVDGIDYSQGEIAALMGISQQMVSQHERAGIKRLEKVYAHLVKASSRKTEE